ncbi:hypothetical protein E8E13_011068 [Curvularia kusanoi]|uniref:Homeobox domain-containing protein n=1 Tax=Curvularia kusanoi TaxID=90978 RepID=A0A9P4WEG1_CURKU|nr:hypothetical protein E8E13_011068 [Curvularia kusanoi]
MNPIPSSPLPIASNGKRASIATTDFAFLVSLPDTVANNMPPDVDNKPLARQKRRRTSKEDEDVLKAEYLINPKPDKAARLEIVSKVALGEKEVQIWFQNKRQNDRRRSRPLDPSSSASLMSSSSIMSDPAIEDEHARVSGNAPEPGSEAPRTDAPAPAQPTTPEAVSDETVPETPEERRRTVAAEHDTQTTTQPTIEPSTDPQTADTAPTEITNSQQSASTSQGAQPRTSWISNRRSASFVRSAEDYAPETITFPNAPSKVLESPEESKSSDTRPLKRAHSFVRIATNEDGSARVVTDLDKTPSPPHPKTTPVPFARAAAGLRRSYSAAGLNDRLLAAARGEPSPKLARISPSSVGRSRDSRAWEFWCDPDTRHNTSLTARAEQEGSGSAADAIGLLRANRRILAQNQARQNTPLKSRQSSYKALGSSGVKKSRSMQRASTFNVFSSGKKQKDSDETESDDFPSTESDKENWEPDMPKSVRRRGFATPASATRPRQILGENTNIISQSASLSALLAKAKKGNKSTVDPEKDDELRAFMNGDNGSARTNLSSAEEAGCVEGLLALSQGQWR